MDGDQFGRLAYLALLLTAVGGWVLVEYRGRLGVALRTALAWGMIVVGLMAGYGLWSDIRRDVQGAQVVRADAVEIPRAPDGHYYATLSVGGKAIRFMADTGASGVVLSKADAGALGIDLETVVFAGQSSTANGIVRTARVRLEAVTFGPFSDEVVGAMVTDGEMDISLLGMDYLGMFTIEIAGDRMVLRR